MHVEARMHEVVGLAAGVRWVRPVPAAEADGSETVVWFCNAYAEIDVRVACQMCKDLDNSDRTGTIFVEGVYDPETSLRQPHAMHKGLPLCEAGWSHAAVSDPQKRMQRAHAESRVHDLLRKVSVIIPSSDCWTWSEDDVEMYILL